MSRKHIITYTLFSGAVSGNEESALPLNTKGLDKASIHLTWSNGSSPNIEAKVQARNGEKDAWRTLDFGTAISISGASGEHEIVLNELPFTDVKLVLEHTSGSADVVAEATAKSVGA